MYIETSIKEICTISWTRCSEINKRLKIVIIRAVNKPPKQKNDFKWLLSERVSSVNVVFSWFKHKTLCFTVHWSPIEDQTSRVCASGSQLLSSGIPQQHNLFQPWTNTSDSTIISRRWINWIRCISLTSHGGKKSVMELETAYSWKLSWLSSMIASTYCLSAPVWLK